MILRTSTPAVETIKRFEGQRLEAYKDTAGKPTIGYGHLIRPGEKFDGYITEERATTLLKADLRAAEDAVRAAVSRPLKQSQFDALVSFTFNLGAAAFTNSKLRNVVEAGNDLEVAREFARWSHVTDVQGVKRLLKGLLRRRLEEAMMYLKD